MFYQLEDCLLTMHRLNALARETENPDMRAIRGASSAATGVDKQGSATAIAMTLSKLTATDIVLIAQASGVPPSRLLHSSVED